MLINGSGNQAHMPIKMEQTTAEYQQTPIYTKVVSSTPERLRLRIAHSHRQPQEMQRIANALQANPNVKDVRINPQHGSVTIFHKADEKSLESVFATLQDLDIIFGALIHGNSEAAVEVSQAVIDLNKQVQLATDGAVDLRFLFPLGLAFLSIRQLLNKGLQLEIIPWYVLAWYAFDSFIKLHATSHLQYTKQAQIVIKQ